MQALELFLACCRHKAIQPLESAAKAGLQQAGLQDLLTTMAATVQVMRNLDSKQSELLGPLHLGSQV